MQSLIREVGIKRIVKYFFYSLWIICPNDTTILAYHNFSRLLKIIKY